MSHYDLFGPRRLGWRPVTLQGWTMVAVAVVAAVLATVIGLHG